MVFGPLEQLRLLPCIPIFPELDEHVDEALRNLIPLFKKYKLQVQDRQWKHQYSCKASPQCVIDTLSQIHV